ncbi:DUF4347 domain-containing protein [Phormidium sp. FACHB-592]|uniref:DUF4347 domain-containing protein n=1 Tax=Stenomitos frigidus AS-A4 TaxID=2933935 RepID=A0ABV0KRD5_9CYAN|nr:DUF4347 domain-containing protein [Phormidium sp. FACHB-592]MBD2075897.1 DUF4347 domain-containing protein [Phormidium sp. FACHB-592]
MAEPALEVSALLLGCVSHAVSTACLGCPSITAIINIIYPSTLVMEAAFSSTANRQLLSTTLTTAALNPTEPTNLIARSDSFLPLSQRSSAAPNLVFIDSSISDYQSLLAGVQLGTEVHWLDTAHAAIDQITQTLLGRTGISSLHIVSHGKAGGLALGTDWLNLDNLHNYSSELQSWGHALTDDADILLYGCDVAQGTIGQSFVQQFAQLTGADIAASDDRTGNAALGGNWTLEVNIGNIDAPLAFLPITMQSYGGVLDDAVFANAQHYTGGTLNSQSAAFADSSGNTYITGSFSGTVDFDPGAGSFTLTSVDSLEIFVSKLDANGNFVWAKGLGGTSSYDGASGISVDSSGNIYTTGRFTGTVDFDPGAGSFTLTSTGAAEVFVSKLDANGNFVWAKGFGVTSSGNRSSVTSSQNGISVDSSGNVYTTGSFTGTVDFDPGTGTFDLTSTAYGAIFVSKLDTAGNFVWAKQLGGGSNIDQVNGISVDSSGNVYTTGHFAGTSDFNPGAGTFNLTSEGSVIDIFISKLDAGGNFAWAKRIGSRAGDSASGISVDSSGNVYTTGFFTGIVDFDPNPGTRELNSSFFNSNDMFVSKLDTNGNYVWAKSIGTYASASSISVDSAGNVYTTGSFVNTVDFAPGTGTFNLISAPSSDIFVSKLDTAGNFVWAKQLGGVNNDSANSISITSNGNVYVTGYFTGIANLDPAMGTVNVAAGEASNLFFAKLSAAGNFISIQQFTNSTFFSLPNSTIKTVVDGFGNVYTVGSFSGTVDFDPSIGTTFLTSTTGSTDIFVSKLDASNNLVWVRHMGGNFRDLAKGLSIDDNGNVYTTGYFHDTADFDPGTSSFRLASVGDNDIFVSKLDSNGNFVWARRMGGSSSDYASSISVDGSGNVYTTGGFQGTVDFDPGTSSFRLASVGDNDIFVSKLDSNGNFVWAKSLGGGGEDPTSSISVDGSGNVYTTGGFQGSLDFDPSMGTFDLTSAGDNDIFVSKLDSNGNFVWARRMGGSSSDYASSISVDGSGNVYTTGGFNGYTTGGFQDTVDFDPGTGTFNLTSTGFINIFVSKLDSNGNFVWAKSLGGGGENLASSINVDSSGRIYVAGLSYGAIDFDSDTDTDNLTRHGATNIFLLQLSQVPAPVVSVEAASFKERNSDTTAYTFTVNLSNTSAQTVSVNYMTEDGTGTVADSDYTAISGVLTFNPGETSKTITVNVKGDTNIEQDETFLVKLLNATNATIAPETDTGTGTIVNDDYAQLLWRDSVSGQNVVWQLNGSTLQSSYYLPTVADLNWQIISSTADFNRDGYADILWRNRATGENAIWQMNSTGYQTGYFITAVADVNWRIIDTGDFNGDGTADLVWRHRVTGENAIWQINGFSIQTAALITTVADVNWQIVSTADLNNDGKTDLLWRNQVTGENAIWQMNGFATKSAFFITTVADTNWQVAGTADLNSDGIADLVWRNRATGENALWQMNSTGLQSGSFITTVADSNWQIAGVTDLGGDRTPDLLWRNAATGQAAIWQLSSFSFLQSYLLPNVPSEWSVRPFTIA